MTLRKQPISKVKIDLSLVDQTLRRYNTRTTLLLIDQTNKNLNEYAKHADTHTDLGGKLTTQHFCINDGNTKCP